MLFIKSHLETTEIVMTVKSNSKYLGISQNHILINYNTTKSTLWTEFIRRIEAVLTISLNTRDLIKAIKSDTNHGITFSLEIIKRSDTDDKIRYSHEKNGSTENI